MDPERFSHLQQEFCNEFHTYGSREILSFGNKSFAMSFIPMDLERFSLFSWKARVNQQPPEHHPLEG
jgi:hypothetical protein